MSKGYHGFIDTCGIYDGIKIIDTSCVRNSNNRIRYKCELQRR